jgi:hypothetical protein
MTRRESRSRTWLAIGISFLFVTNVLFLAGPLVPQASAQSPSTPPKVYVSTTGSDATGNGSLAAPYATISHAVSTSPPHAVIFVEPGMYAGMVNISKPITLQSLSSDPSNTIINAMGRTYGIYVLGQGASGTTIESLTVKGANDHGIFVQDASEVTVEHDVVVGNGLHPNKCPSAPAPRTGPCIAEDKAVEFSGTSYSTIVTNTVDNNIADGGIGVSDDGSNGPGSPTGGTPTPGLGNLVSGNTIIGNIGGCGIVVAAYNPGEGVTNNIVSNNYVVNGLPGGIVVAADVPHTSAVNNSVIYNTVFNNQIPGVIVHSNTPGDLVSGTNIIGNTVSGNAGFGPKTTGINLISNINGSTVVSKTTISGNVLHNEFFGILAQNATSTTVLPDNTFDSSITVPIQGAVVSQLSLGSLSSEIGGLSSTLGSLQATLSQLQSSAAKGSDLSALTSTVNSLQSTLSQLQSTAAKQNDLSSLSSTVNSSNGQISTLATVSYAALVVAIVLGLTAIALAVRKRG